MIVGVLTLELFFPYARSLKDKRRILHGFKDRVAPPQRRPGRDRFPGPVAEDPRSGSSPSTASRRSSRRSSAASSPTPGTSRRPRSPARRSAMSEKGFRTRRVAELVQAELSRLLITEFQDPASGLLTVTRVEMTPGPAHGPRLPQRLRRRAIPTPSSTASSGPRGCIRKALASRIKLKYNPRTIFRPGSGPRASGPDRQADRGDEEAWPLTRGRSSRRGSRRRGGSP